MPHRLSGAGQCGNTEAGLLVGRVAGSYELVQGVHGCVEGGAPNDVGPPLLYLGNSIPRCVEGVPPPPGGIDQLGSAVGGIGVAFQVAPGLQVVDQLGGRGWTQLRAGGEVGEPDAVDADVAEDLKVCLAQVVEACLGCRRQQLGAELSQQPAE